MSVRAVCSVMLLAVGACGDDDEAETDAQIKSYKDRVARLRAENRMQPPGLQAVAEGKRSGLWTFMDDVDALIVPEGGGLRREGRADPSNVGFLLSVGR